MCMPDYNQLLYQIQEQNQATHYRHLMTNLCLNLEFPSKNYTRYRSQSKTNPLLNKLGADAGYPQELINEPPNSQRQNNKNYLQLNKKNLRNFFTDRLPPKDVQVFKQSFTIDPSKLFEIKRKNQQQRNVTKSTVQQKIDEGISKTKLHPRKITENFNINDKNREFKLKFLNNSLYVNKPYESNNFLKGTHSYLHKYNKITKKQAYHSVFGLQTSAMLPKQSKIATEPQMNEKARPKTFSTSRQNAKDEKQMQSQRRKFSSMIAKIDGYRQTFDPQNRCAIKPYTAPQPVDEHETYKKQMITWIKDLTKGYKNEALQLDRNKIKDLGDLSKIDSKFFQQLQAHKSNRLQKRQTAVYSSSIKSRLSNHNSPRKTLSRQKQQKQVSVSESQQENIENYLQKTKIKKKPRRNPKQLIRMLCKFLIRSMNEALLFGMKDKLAIYKAFYKRPDPYQKSGSYAFFKSIKNGDFEGIKKFIALDIQFIYERDYKGRNGLIYAAMVNQLDIVAFLLTSGSNPNSISDHGKTALYYGIKNQNIQMVKTLLQSGANPWSMDGCLYNTLLNQVGNEKLKNLFSNARRISIAIKMRIENQQKIQLWESIKSRIREDIVINFQ